MKPLVIYHAQCRDGFCAAWVAWNHFHDGAEYHAAQYGTTPPETANRDVFMVDFSYPRTELERIADTATAFVILDHHESAQAALEGFEAAQKILGNNVLCVFDMAHSGAALAQAYFGAGEMFEQAPPLVRYVEDRDLWRFALPNSKEINAWIATIPFDFAMWSAAESLLAFHREKVIELGQVALAKTRTYVAEVCRNTRIIDFHIYNDVPCVNAPQVDISEVLEGLIDAYGAGLPLALGWWLRADGMVQVSLRSRGELNVAEIAKRYGGGGHKNAAGFQIGVSRWAQVLTS